MELKKPKKKYNCNTRAILRPIDVSKLDEVEINSQYQNLACAIINSGYKNKDTKFLQSEWCDILKYFCSLKLKGFDANCYVGG